MSAEPSAELDTPPEQGAAERTPQLAVAVVAGDPTPFRERVVSALAQCGARTLTTHEGPATFDGVRRTIPRLLVSSTYLPGLTGAEVAAAALREPSLAGLRIVLYGPKGSLPEELAGVDALVPEGETLDDLVALFEALLANEELPDRVDEKAMRRAARVAAADLLLYHGEELKAEPLPEHLAVEVRDSRAWCARRFPLARSRAGRAFDEALDGVRAGTPTD